MGQESYTPQVSLGEMCRQMQLTERQQNPDNHDDTSASEDEDPDTT